MHVHQNVWRKNGSNLFGDGAGGPRAAGQQYVAGLLEHGLAHAVWLPKTERLPPAARLLLLPCGRVPGWDNWTLAVRAITGTDVATRIEQRDAATDCNTYLTTAGQFAAGLTGLRAGKGPPAPVTGDAYARADLPRPPRFFPEAYDGLASPALARNPSARAPSPPTWTCSPPRPPSSPSPAATGNATATRTPLSSPGTRRFGSPHDRAAILAAPTARGLPA